MKFISEKLMIQHSQNSGKWGLFMTIPTNVVDELSRICKNEKSKSVEIKIKREARSLNANAYFWTLTNQLAAKMGMSNTEMYEILLHEYGMIEYLVAPEGSESLLRKAYKIVEFYKDTLVEGKPAKIFRLIRGSSSYDTSEMSRLIEGTVSECKDQGIETMTPAEIGVMMLKYDEDWRKQNV